MIKPEWIAFAETQIGIKEIVGIKNEPKILTWWKMIKRGGIKADSVPWCAAFVGACLEQSGIVSTRFEAARSYLNWGVRLSQPQYGCIVVFERNGGGHVGFVVGRTQDNRLMVLGGNQDDSVNIKPFDPNRVSGYRWPKAVPPLNQALPIIKTSEKSSTNEA